MQSGNPYQGQDAAANKIITKNEYHEIKKEVIAYEKKNQNCIRLIPCSGNQGWYEIPEISAIIYYYEVCVPLGITVSFTDDSDSYYSQYLLGRIRTRSPETVESRLKTAKLFKSKITENRQIIFVLSKKYHRSYLEELIEKERSRRETNNSIIKINFSDPVLHQMLSELARRLHGLCNAHLDKLSCETNGVRIVTAADKLLINYYKSCSPTTIKLAKNSPHPYNPYVSYLLETLSVTENLLYELQITSELKLLSYDSVLSVSKVLLDLRAHAKEQLRIIKKQQNNHKKEA